MKSNFRIPMSSKSSFTQISTAIQNHGVTKMLRPMTNSIGLLFLAFFIVGCQYQVPATSNNTANQNHHEKEDHKEDASDESEIAKTLAKLSSEDRKLAEEQKFCAVMNHERLGGMGVPIKLDVKGEAIFVCCSGCKKKALSKPDETLANVSAMKASNKSGK